MNISYLNGYNKKISNETWPFRNQRQQEKKEKSENEKAAQKKQPLSLEEIIARREGEKKDQKKVNLNYTKLKNLSCAVMT